MTGPRMDLLPIREREEAAAKGPWTLAAPRADGRNAVERVSYIDPFTGKASNEWVTLDTDPATAAFIAHAREDIPALITECDRLYEKTLTERAARNRILRDRDEDRAYLLPELQQARAEIEELRSKLTTERGARKRERKEREAALTRKKGEIERQKADIERLKRGNW